MYVVGYGRSALKIGPGDVRKTGEPIPEAKGWKPHVLQSHLSMKFVMTEGEYKEWKKQADAHNAAVKKRKDKEKQLRKEHERSLTLAKETALENGVGPQDVTGDSEDKTEEPDDSEVETEETEEASEESSEETALEDLNKSQLKKMAKDMDLPVSGTKEELLARIQEVRA